MQFPSAFVLGWEEDTLNPSCLSLALAALESFKEIWLPDGCAVFCLALLELVELLLVGVLLGDLLAEAEERHLDNTVIPAEAIAAADNADRIELELLSL